jgi:hypothetical protein
MKKKIIITILSAIAVLIGAVVILFHVTFGDMIAQMSAGKDYMKSLTDSDIPVWIDRSIALMETHKTTNDFQQIRLYGDSIPQQLQDIRISGINIFGDQVWYVWVGGLDHTCLRITRLTNDAFEVYAQYNDESGEKIWPKK